MISIDCDRVTPPCTTPSTTATTTPTTNNNNTIFTGNLPIDVNYNDLQELFQLCGTINKVKFKYKKDSYPEFAFITFNTTDAVDLALEKNDTIFKGRLLRVGRARRFNKKYNPNTIQLSISFKTKTYPKLITEETLRDAFSTYSQVYDVCIKKRKYDEATRYQAGHAFIHYSNDKDALHALVKFNNNNEIKTDGIAYQCTVANNSEHLHQYLNYDNYNALQQGMAPIPYYNNYSPGYQSYYYPASGYYTPYEYNNNNNYYNNYVTQTPYNITTNHNNNNNNYYSYNNLNPQQLQYDNNI